MSATAGRLACADISPFAATCLPNGEQARDAALQDLSWPRVADVDVREALFATDPDTYFTTRYAGGCVRWQVPTTTA